MPHLAQCRFIFLLTQAGFYSGQPMQELGPQRHSMRDYFYQRFPSQLARLEFRRPSEIVREHMMRDHAVVFFGGPDWENARSDLASVPEEDRSRFILCLFMVVVTDQVLYTYFSDIYDTWRKLTNFPKFGWSGFGPHNENPFKLLWAPERDDIININNIFDLVPEFVRFWVDETASFFRQDISDIDVARYFDAIRRDQGYAFNLGTVVLRVKAELQA
jgi:hypothetical protein